ncbi:MULTISPECIES: hypothetical protein [Rhodanobacter]|uniref:Uncharacterized protein n=1 Tax=Rhodanobacter lindaniclasticus TaxID=75310 RepID=A0A4S3KKZ3_9GAMM|nr:MULTISPECIES: hypothetical protein [Rhodanobacter]MBQ4855808.1 hypothetical protein [Rhodanobacter sp. B2A1Ga4]THD09446.1 hypothetical protein B1991_02275 [Rhodanobacter lindaniclasticus]
MATPVGGFDDVLPAKLDQFRWLEERVESQSQQCTVAKFVQRVAEGSQDLSDVDRIQFVGLRTFSLSIELKLRHELIPTRLPRSLL